MDLHVSPLGRVEGDLDVRVTITDGVVTDAWTEAAMFRGFEIILRGKDPQAGLIVTPRICGICGGSHLYKACYALDTAWRTHVPPNATLVRNIAQVCETLQSIPRYFYALFAIDLTNKKLRELPAYDEAVRRFAPFVGTSYETGVTLSASRSRSTRSSAGSGRTRSFMIPGGVMCAPTLSDVTRVDRDPRSLEARVAREAVARLLGRALDADQDLGGPAGLGRRERVPAQLRLRVLHPLLLELGLDKYGQGYGNYIATGTYFEPELYENPTIEGRNAALISRSGIYAGGKYHDFDQARVREDITHSFYEGTGSLHPLEGETDPIDPLDGRKQGKYSWAKSPRYDVPGPGHVPLEAGPLARQVIAGRPDAAAHQDYDPLFLDIYQQDRPERATRVLARMHEAPKYSSGARGSTSSTCTTTSTPSRSSTSRARASAPPRPPAARCRTGS